MAEQILTQEGVTREQPYSLRYQIRKSVILALDYAILILLSFFFLFPVIFMLVTAFKTNEDQILRDVAGLRAFVPYGPLGLQNFFDVFNRMEFGRFMWNSVFVVGVTVILGLVVNSMAAYALARLRWGGRKIVLAVIIALIIIPFEAVAVPLLLLVNNLPWINGTVGWLDTYHVQIIPFIADAFSIFLFYQFFIGLPKDLEEAALVDGASRFRIYWNIIVPLSRPVFATVAILKFLYYWGSYLWPLMVTRRPEVRPLTVGMQQFFGQYPRLWGDIMAFASMITIPVLIIFLLFQKWFVQSVASSGVKG
ncbi:MAG: carbohydrate ABC transporter permease [Chloroflexota bacterium]|jgi:multiple sugar transport system permease protein